MKIQDALSALERELHINAPFGLDQLPPETRYQQVLYQLQQTICPHREAILTRLRSEGLSLTTCVFDSLLSTFAGIPTPVSTIAKGIAVVGLEKFCTNPASILNYDE
jgi:hypothetical protein